MATDTRPPVLYLRAFWQESEPFAYVPPKEIKRYTRWEGTPRPAVTLEQYLGGEFARRVGPFIALGNPLDSVPPEGAARSYAPDEDWQRHFSTHAATAAAIVIDGSFSGNLHWELTEITRNGWQGKLFFLIAPALPRRGRPGPGSVIAFDAAGHAEVLMRGAQRPEEFVTTVRTRLCQWR